MKKPWNPEAALVSRRVAYETDDAVTIIEVWDTSHPDSPWVPVPFSGQGNIINPHIRAIKFTPEEYRAANIPLKESRGSRGSSPASPSLAIAKESDGNITRKSGGVATNPASGFGRRSSDAAGVASGPRDDSKRRAEGKA